ncbi:MAG: RIP metalloprotease RseP [Flavobacterium sp. BFFFF2]|nr:MAG: RIP metalloprotease RseP [Flavobacterium sp. BFFFF2]
MEIVIKLGQFLLSLSLLIVLHELGHFIPAKLFKTRVEKFYLFFDIKYSLLKKKIGETEYGIGWLPLGGYVKIAGMIDESMDTEQLNGEPQAWEFRSKPAWQRLIIMLGGVLVNFILAFVIYIGITAFYGEQYIDNKDVTNGVWVANPALKSVGIQTGDQIVAVDGEPVERFYELNEKILLAHHVTVIRANKEITLDIPVDFPDQIMKAKLGALVQLRIPFIVKEMTPGSANVNVFKPKDQLLQFDGKDIQYADQLIEMLPQYAGKTIACKVLRDQQTIDVNAQVNNKGKFGLQYAVMLPPDNLEKLGLYKIHQKEYSFVESIPIGISHGWNQLTSYGRQLKAIFNPSTGAYKGVGGFAAIFNVFPQTWSWLAFWSITAFLSIMLGVMNLLPIPALDGGHVVFLLYEIVSGRKPSDKFLEKAQMVGFFMLIALLLFANGNDLFKFITGK